MAVTVSGMYVTNWKAQNNGTDLLIDWVNDVIKFALFTNTLTPNYSTDSAFGSAPFTSNQVSGTGYTAGGATLGSKTCTESPTGTIMYDAADPSWSGATFSSVRCGITHDTTLSIIVDPALSLTNFGADYAVTSGTLTVQLSALGLITIDITP